VLYKIDEIDRKIIDWLTKDGRMTMADIARKINLSRVATRERFNKLVEEGVIHQFTAIIDSRALGFGIPVFFEIEIKPEALELVCEELVKHPEVTIVYQMTGPTSLHVHAYLRDTNDLAEFLRDKVYKIAGVLNVTTSLLIRRFKSNLSLR